MNNMRTKPKLVFFHFKYDENVPEFLLAHNREHIKCLSESFDLTVIHEDCDYQQICEKYEPDLTLFESGLQVRDSRRLQIRNSCACPEIPKLGFLNADAWSETRGCILSDMEHWGIGTFFSISIAAAEHNPEIAQNLFIWPNFIDAEIFRDYGESKIVPFVLTGSQDPQYPWRHKVYKIISDLYPSLICPHHGYYSRTGVGQMMHGEQYARMINASWFGPTCGTVVKEVVRKHFEIPGSKACLITEQSPGVEAAGFVDMKNCVFADEHTISDKLDYLFRHRDELYGIINAGYQLVHSHHTIKQRDQIFQWFSLHRTLRKNQKIVQSNPFGPLTVVEESSGIDNSHIISNGLHLTLLRQGDKLLWAGKYEEAEHLYLKSLNYVGPLAEAKLGMALCNLHKGNPKAALFWIAQPIQYALSEYEAIDPDPVEWAYFIICLVCLGKIKEAAKQASQFPWLHHPELDRTRLVLTRLATMGNIDQLPHDHEPKRRCSVHQLPNRSYDEWVEQLCIMLKVCGQFAAVEALKKCLSPKPATFREKQDDAFADRKISPVRERNLDVESGRKDALIFFKRRLFYRKLGVTLKNHAADALHELERKFGYFLPYRWSAMRKDRFFKAIRDLPREEEIKTALVIGAAIGQGSTESFLAGVLENEKKSTVFCVSGSKRRFTKLIKTFANNPIVKWYDLPPCLPEDLPGGQLEKTVKEIKDDNHIKFFDAVLIDGSRIKQHHQLTMSAELNRELHGARFVLLNGINRSYNYKNHNGLLNDPHYVLIAHNLDLHDGYAIFKRKLAPEKLIDNGIEIGAAEEQDS